MTTDAKTTRDRAEMPHGTSRVLDRRSLAHSHKRLAALLAPGLRVLDVGCGTGAITADAADVVGATGLAVGLDINQPLLDQARTRRQPSRPALRFVRGSVAALPFAPVFDIVTAARVLQWLAQPEAALAAMFGAAGPGGTVLVLDYDHERIAWTPAPPPSMQRFYAAFLAWRADAGFSNTIAGALPAMFERVGATGITSSPQPEITVRGDAAFVEQAGLWADVAASRGHQMVRDGFITEAEREAAERDYRVWVADDAESMALHLAAVEGARRP